MSWRPTVTAISVGFYALPRSSRHADAAPLVRFSPTAPLPRRTLSPSPARRAMTINTTYHYLSKPTACGGKLVPARTVGASFTPPPSSLSTQPFHASLGAGTNALWPGTDYCCCVSVRISSGSSPLNVSCLFPVLSPPRSRVSDATRLMKTHTDGRTQRCDAGRLHCQTGGRTIHPGPRRCRDQYGSGFLMRSQDSGFAWWWIRGCLSRQPRLHGH